MFFFQKTRELAINMAFYPLKFRRKWIKHFWLQVSDQHELDFELYLVTKISLLFLLP